MTRYNIFYESYKAMRAGLFETASELQRTDFSKEVSIMRISNEVCALFDLFETRKHQEERVFFAALWDYEPSVLDSLLHEHIAEIELAKKVRMLLRIYPSLQFSVEKTQLGSAIRRAFMEFVTFALVHLAKKEQVLNPLLWRYFNDEMILQMQQEINATYGLSTGKTMWKWVIRGLSSAEFANWSGHCKGLGPVLFEDVAVTTETDFVLDWASQN